MFCTIRVWYIATIRVLYNFIYHTRMVHTIRVWYVPYAYVNYSYVQRFEI